MRDVMVDIETLGTRAGSVILSLGAVGFDRNTGQISPLHFHMSVSVASSLRLGATVDAQTVSWWRDQSVEAQAVIWRSLSGGDELPDVLKAFAEWLQVQGQECELPVDARHIKIWGNGSDFDNVLLAAACGQVGIPLPWNHFNNRCFRTLKDEHRHLEPHRRGVHHDALDDAIHQARWACAIFSERDRARRLYDRILNPTAADVATAA